MYVIMLYIVPLCSVFTQCFSFASITNTPSLKTRSPKHNSPPTALTPNLAESCKGIKFPSEFTPIESPGSYLFKMMEQKSSSTTLRIQFTKSCWSSGISFENLPNIAGFFREMFRGMPKPKCMEEHLRYREQIRFNQHVGFMAMMLSFKLSGISQSICILFDRRFGLYETNENL
jgi:hypothetical protein